MVNALGGVDVCLTTNLDDYSYPNYSNGYMPIHFKAGCQHLSGEQALEIARSRHAEQSAQSSDFGRAKRQQDIMQAIKKRATTVNGFAKAPQLLDALQKNINTDMSISDMKAIYDWGKNLPDSSIIRVALTANSGAAPGNVLEYGDCGLGSGVSQLCADDPSFNQIQRYLANVLVPLKTLAEKAPIQFTNGASNFGGLDSLVTTMFDPTGLQLADPVSRPASAQTVILDYSGGRFPLTVKWLLNFFGGTVVVATPATYPPASGQQTYGLVVVLGRDFAQHFWGE
jgi:hypothetical protein